MNEQQLFDHELANIGTGGAATVEIEAGGRHVRCNISERNTLAVSVSRLSLSTDELANADAARLERLGKVLAARLTYLMEPISPIEHDAAACVVQLRSYPPQRDDDSRSYYELMVRRGGEMSLTRYRKENSGVRQLVAATVTREVLLRLIGDFCEVLD